MKNPLIIFSFISAFSGVAMSPAFGQDRPTVDCEAVLTSNVLDRTEVTQGINIITRLREDICSRQFESASAAREYARSGGVTFGVDSLFDFGVSDAKDRTATNYTVSESRFCSMSTRDLTNESNLSFTDVVGQFALRAFESCVKTTNQGGLWISYDVREQEGILTASIFRRLIGVQPADLELNEVEIVVSGEETNVECRLPGDVIATSNFDVFDVPIEVAGTVSRISCTKTGPGGAAIIVRTSSGDLQPLKMLSEKEIEDRDADFEQTEINLVADRVEELENWLPSLKLTSRVVRSDLPGARTPQTVTCAQDERVTACNSYVSPGGSLVCGTGITDDGQSCHSSGCVLPEGQSGYVLQAVCTRVQIDR